MSETMLNRLIELLNKYALVVEGEYCFTPNTVVVYGDYLFKKLPLACYAFAEEYGMRRMKNNYGFMNEKYKLQAYLMNQNKTYLELIDKGFK